MVEVTVTEQGGVPREANYHMTGNRTEVKEGVHMAILYFPNI